MDRLTTLELFTRIVDRRSFTAGAADMKVSRPVATAAIQALERRLGMRLLQRSTRSVMPTVEGEIYYERCLGILADVEDADRSAGGTISGRLRVDVAGNLARTTVLPALPDFLARHPGLTVHLSEGERFVDLVREGFDCVVRGGALADSDMIVRQLGVMDEVTCASPAYLAENGVPATPDDLGGHWMIGFVSSRTAQVMPLEFTRDGKTIEMVLPARLLVNGSDTYTTAARFGLGLLQSPRHRVARDLAAGTLIEVLSAFSPTPTLLSVLYPTSRQLAPRVRVFVDWLVEILSPLTHPA